MSRSYCACENHFWISLADSDILLWAQGVSVHSGLKVNIREPDVSPLQLQGPKSGEVMKALFGKSIIDLQYYWFREVELDGIPLIVSRTGWSSELGYELYLQDGALGDELWEKIMAAGTPFGLKPGHTSSIRRIEGGMLSYQADADINTNPCQNPVARKNLNLADLEKLCRDFSYVFSRNIQCHNHLKFCNDSSNALVPQEQ